MVGELLTSSDEGRSDMFVTLTVWQGKPVRCIGKWPQTCTKLEMGNGIHFMEA